jgi:dihydrofolate reductase
MNTEKVMLRRFAPSLWASASTDSSRGQTAISTGITIQLFLRAGLIHRLILSRLSMHIGKGIPLFGSVPHDIRLSHVTTRTYPAGMVQSEYHVVNRAGELP